MGRTITEEALDLGRATNGAAGVRAYGYVQPGVGAFACSWTGRRGGWVLVAISSRVERVVEIDPVGCCLLAISKLAGFHFANDDCSGIDESLDRKGGFIGWWVEGVPSAVSVAGLHARNVVDVFDSEAHSCKRFRCRACVV